MSTSTIPFLDLALSITESNNLDINLYSKPTDKHLFLNYTSCHPTSCKSSLAFSLALRLKRICSTPANYLQQVDKLTTHLLARGYRLPMIKQAINKVESQFRITETSPATSQAPHKKASRTPFTLTYHPKLAGIGKSLHQHYNRHISSDPSLNSQIPQPPFLLLRDVKIWKTFSTLHYHRIITTLPSVVVSPDA